MKRSTQQKFIEACTKGIVLYYLFTIEKCMRVDINRHMLQDAKLKYVYPEFTATYKKQNRTIYLKEHVVDTDSPVVVEELITRYTIPMRKSRIYRIDDLWIHIDMYKQVRVYKIKEVTI